MNEDRPATQAEGYRELVNNMGQDKPDQQWILTPYGTWEKNPCYVGPDQPHPEDDCGDHLCPRCACDPCKCFDDDPRLFPGELSWLWNS